MTPQGGTHLLVNEPQRVLDVRALEGDGGGGALEQLHEQVVEEPDWGEDHVAQLKRQGPTPKVSAGLGGGLPPALPANPSWCPPSEPPLLTVCTQGTPARILCRLGVVTKTRLLSPSGHCGVWKRSLCPGEQG